MPKFLKNAVGKVNTTLGFFTLTVVLFWLKTYIAYKTEFTLGVKGAVQEFLLILNPFPTAIVLLGIALYFRGRLKYWLLMTLDAIQTTWLFANILYYREFSDFMSAGVIKSSGAASNNLGTSLGQIIHWTDFLVYADVLLLILLLAFKVIRIDPRPFKVRYAATLTMIGVALFAVDLGMSEHDRSDLLTRTFDNNYIVKYLGLNTYAGYSFYQTEKESATRAQASSSDMKSVLAYLKKNQADENIKYFGKAKGKNVFVIHLESFQQFMIDYKSDGKEVTPTLNKFYHDKHTLSFDNFYHQVAQGKTSDAEMMMENSLFGLPTGSAMTQYGTSNTFQAAPAILAQKGYTTAAFHGDVASFWNRDNAYKSWGYDYFFYSAYYKEKANYTVGYGLKDKIFFKDSVKYLEQLPQPFYAKLITLTNHYPYTLDKENQTIAKTKTGDSTVDGYVQTARYLDQSFAEFISYLKKAGLYKNSMLVLYGDHYGISNNHRSAIAQLLGKKSVNNADLAQFQKVPFMIHADGIEGGINHTYGGEIDALPTIFDLLGIKNKGYVQFGTDLLSKDHNQTVAFRNGDFVSPKYTKVGSTVYDTKTSQKIENLTAKQKETIKQMQNHVTTQLSLSDRVIQGDLLRFYTPKGFKKVNVADYSYKVNKTLESLKDVQAQKKTSLLHQRKGKTSEGLYKTDAPELTDDSSSESSSSSSAE